MFSTELPPRNPLDFPPILFVKPSHVTTTSMWEYQMEMSPSLAMTYPGRIGLGSATGSGARTSKSAPRPRVLGGSLSFTPEPLPQRLLSPPPSRPGSESSDPPSPPPSSTLPSTSSYPSFQVDKASEHGPRSHPSDSGSRSRNGKAREWSAEPGELPFPILRTSPRSYPSARSHGSRASTAITSASPGGAIRPIAYSSYYSSSAASSLVPEAPPGSAAVSSSGSSTAVSSSASLSRPSNAKSPSTSPPQRPWRSSEKLAKSKAESKSSAGTAAKATPSFSSTRRLGHQRPYSFTELCDQSLFMSKSEMFAPPAPIARSSDFSAIAPSLSRAPAIAEAREPPPLRPPRHPRQHANILQTSSRAHLIASAPLRSIPVMPPEPDSGLEIDNEKAKVRKPKRATKGGEHASIDKGTKGASKFLTTIDSRGVNIRDGSTVKKRGRDTRGKRLGASENLDDRAAALV
ncbi:hypothetical protein V8D89_013630 [Ganoderma adspersum]